MIDYDHVIKNTEYHQPYSVYRFRSKENTQDNFTAMMKKSLNKPYPNLSRQLCIGQYVLFKEMLSTIIGLLKAVNVM